MPKAKTVAAVAAVDADLAAKVDALITLMAGLPPDIIAGFERAAHTSEAETVLDLEGHSARKLAEILARADG